MSEDCGGSAEVQTEEPPAISPSDFDPVFYVEAYPDIHPEVTDPTLHFIHHGRAERRFATRAMLAKAAATVRESGCFDSAWYRKTFGIGSRAIEHYLLRESHARTAPNPTFDRRFFAAYYFHTIPVGEVPFVTFCRHSKRRWCRDHLGAFEAQARTLADDPAFNDDYFREACGDLDGEIDAAAYYLTEGFRRHLSTSKRFNTRAYLSYYPDIVNADLNPLLHFVEYGRAEGRLSFGEEHVRRVRGAVPMRPARSTVLVVSHEGSLSGAPIVGLNLARTLGETYNVVSVLLRAGPLTEDFAKASHDLAIVGDSLAHMMNGLEVLTGRFDISCAVLNSVECTKMLPMLVERGIPAVSLMHEFAQYVFPFDQFARSLALSDVAVFPSKLVEEHARQELRTCRVPDGDLPEVRIRPQGRPLVPVVKRKHEVDPALAPRQLERLIARRSAKARPFVVLGAGWVQPRKGVDLFIEVARILTKDLGVDALFIWVGPNYNPRTDTLLSVYLADQIAKSGLENDIVFFDEQPDLGPFYAEADAFLLSSRLDPFPNVAIEAIAEGKHLVCFEGATGIADLARWPEAVTAVPYGDMRAAAETLARLQRSSLTPSVAPRELAPDLRHVLSFDDYVRDIGAAIEDARTRFPVRGAMARALLEDGDFDPTFFARSIPAWVLHDAVQAKSKETLAAIAAVLAVNAMPIGLVRHGRSTGGMTPRSTDWSGSNILTLDPNAQISENSLDFCAHIVFAESREDVALIADLIFATPSIKTVTIVSESLRKDDLLVVERVLGSVTLTLVDPSGPELVEKASRALLDASGPDSLVGVTFAMSLQAALGATRCTFQHACDAALPAEAFFLSSLLLEPDAAFLTDWRSTTPMLAEAPGLALAHRLVDCRGLWLRPTVAAKSGQARLIGSLASVGRSLRSSDVWQILAAPAGLLASGRWAYVSSPFENKPND